MCLLITVHRFVVVNTAAAQFNPVGWLILTALFLRASRAHVQFISLHTTVVRSRFLCVTVGDDDNDDADDDDAPMTLGWFGFLDVVCRKRVWLCWVLSWVGSVFSERV